MSFVVTAPEAVSAAAGDLAAIGSTLHRAAATAASPTTGIAAAAADEVSIAISQLFGRYGQEFQTVSNQMAALHTEFIQTLHRSAEAYFGTEITAAAQLSGQFEAGSRVALQPGLWASNAASGPGGAYGKLFARTSANLEALYSAWSAHPFPFLSQVIANQQVYWREIAAALAGAIQNFPALLANLPAVIEAAVQQFLAFNAAYYIQEIVTTQIGFGQLFATTFEHGVTELIAGWPAFNAEVQLAFQQLLEGDFDDAVSGLARAFANLLVTGYDTSDVTTSSTGTTLSLTANPKILGPLGDLFTIMNIPAQQAQYFTDLIPPSIPREVAQNFTNAVNILTIPRIQAVASFDIATGAGRLEGFFGVPLVLTYAAVGAPYAALESLAASATAIEQAVDTGNALNVLGALVEAPAYAMDGYLNGQSILDMTVRVPTGLGPLLPDPVAITLHLPFDGILVPPHPGTATISFPGYPIPVPGFPKTVTIYGTPFSGMAPLLINYIPQQLAHAIAPAT